jgi:hypothetical protein
LFDGVLLDVVVEVFRVHQEAAMRGRPVAAQLAGVDGEAQGFGAAVVLLGGLG